jgi:integrase
MPETISPAPQVPSYLCHESAGRKRAFCYVYEAGKRRRVYLGAWGSPDSKRRYRDVISTHLGERLPEAPSTREITIEELVGRFLFWAESHYVKHGRPTGEWSNMKDAAAPLLELFRDEPAAAFGPKKLRMVRDQMLQTARFARRTINSRIQRVRRIFRWGVAEELVPARAWDSLRTLLPLQRGRTSARETAPVDPVPLPLLEKTLPHLTPTVRTMVVVQLLTGMRPNEIVQMRVADIETDGPDGCWVFLPRTHKTEHKGRSRRVVLSKRAQRLLKPFMTLDREALLFNPIRSEEERRAMRRRARQSKVPPSQEERDRKNRACPRRKLREAWTGATYLRAIYYACDEAGIEHWSPGRLRHNFEDAAEKSCGLEAASKALGHSQLGTTEHYRNRIDLDQAAKAMKAVEKSIRIRSA